MTGSAATEAFQAVHPDLVPRYLRWDIPGANQGQIVEVAYADDPSHPDPAGRTSAWQRVTDHSDRSVSFYHRGRWTPDIPPRHWTLQTVCGLHTRQRPETITHKHPTTGVTLGVIYQIGNKRVGVVMVPDTNLYEVAPVDDAGKPLEPPQAMPAPAVQMQLDHLADVQGLSNRRNSR